MQVQEATELWKMHGYDRMSTLVNDGRWLWVARISCWAESQARSNFDLLF